MKRDTILQLNKISGGVKAIIREHDDLALTLKEVLDYNSKSCVINNHSSSGCGVSSEGCGNPGCRKLFIKWAKERGK